MATKIRKRSLTIFMSNHQNLLLNKPSGAVWEALYGKKVLIAFSGGKDSLALLWYMREYADICNWKITACHINHRLRGEESQRDEDFCRQICEAANIDFTSVNVDVYSSATYKQRGLEHAARSLRYEALTQQAAKSGADFLATAHTANDALESFFVDLLTGASIYTLGGIAPLNGIFARPMLDISTNMVEDYLFSRGLKAVYDSSNSDTRYVRNFVRNEVLPVFKNKYNELERAVERIQQESAMLSGYFDRLTENFTVNLMEGGVLIKRDLLDSSDEVIKRYVIGKWVSSLARGGKAHIEAIIDQMKRKHSARINLPEHYLCEVTPRSVRIFHKNQVEAFEYTGKTASVGIKHISLPKNLTGDIKIRNRRNGDRYGNKKLKDLYEALKLDPYERDRAVIVEKDGKIIWAEHIAGSDVKVVIKYE